MRFNVFTTVAASLAMVTATGAVAQSPKKAAPIRAAHFVPAASVATPPGQLKRKVDPDQGDDHASPRAIEVVCSKSTPAAERSAICDGALSRG